MKKILLGRVFTGCVLWLGLLSHSVFGQFSNEWISYGQPYYKIAVARNGIYRISQANLQAAGVPVASIDPRRINIYHRGVEQAILVQGQDDAAFDPADYIEFYGQKNDGTLDADLYNPSSLQPHGYYNLFSDTTAYFLTWNPLPVQGRRMTSSAEVNPGLVKDAYHQNERLEIYANEYSGGLTLNGEIQNTAFDKGEGWTGTSFCTGFSGCTGQRDFVLDNMTGAITSQVNPTLDIMLVGRAGTSHSVEIYAGANGGALHLLSTVSFSDFESHKYSFPLTWSDIGSDGRTTVRVKMLASGINDVLSVSYLKIVHAQDFNMGAAAEKIYRLAPNGSGKSYIEIINPPAGARIWDISDPNAPAQIGSSNVAGGIGAVVPNTSTERTLYVANATQTAGITKVSFRQIVPASHNFIIISHRSLMKPALGYGDAVQSYAAYRASAAGGSYDTLTVPIDQLFNQFNFGEYSPRAIYQFMKFLRAGGQPRYLFIIGKGIEVSQGFHRKASFLPTDLHDLVPAAGMPAADMAFTAMASGEPEIPTGRLSATTPVQVAAYLNKVKESESLTATALWRKDILHLSGGINAGEPVLFRSYMDDFKATAESFFLGGRVATLSKQTLNIELINVKDQVNKGLNLITFFGHSGPGTIDIDIGYVSDPTLGYNNAGKYPGFLINGCNAGRFFDNRVTFGEDWIFTANKGAKSFIAHSSFGISIALKSYTDIFYSVAYGDSTFIGRGIGEVQKETARRYLVQNGVSMLSITQVQQMFLLGDPALRLFDPPFPDFEISPSSISVASLDGKPVTAQSESFAIDIDVRNFGRAVPGLLPVRVERTLNDNSIVVYDSLFEPVRYDETLRFVIPKGSTDKEFGIARFKVIIDTDNSIAEINETNNTATLDYFIPLNGTKNLFPYPFAIVNSSNVDLVFQSTDLRSESRGYKLEVDTASTFDSPFLKRLPATGKVLAKVSVNLLQQDSLVYYWRTKLEDPAPSESVDWFATSFVYIQNGQPGWAQVKFPQLADNATSGLVLDPEIRLMKFPQTSSTIAVRTFGSANPAPYTQVSVKINDEEFNIATQLQPCRNNSLNLIAFDRSAAAPYAGIPFKTFDPRSCGREPKLINNFLTNELLTGNGDDLAQWVLNVKASDSVVLFSIGDAGYASWTAAVKQQLEQLGLSVNQMNGIQPGEPFIVFGKKGAAPGAAQVFRPTQAPETAQELFVSKTITGRYTEGSLISTLVGPAQQWSKLTWRIAGGTPSDEFKVDLNGVNVAGQETTLNTDLTGSVDLSGIDASLFPYLKLALRTKDEINLTPVQLKKWLITYTPVAEGMLLVKEKKDVVTMEEGQEWVSNYTFANISTRPFSDSLLVQADFASRERGLTKRQTFRVKPPSPGDSINILLKFNTKGWGGSNDVTVFVNPYVLPEQYYDNNVLTLFDHLQVVGDETAPVLRVTIDGRTVENGDEVSASPVIVAEMIDKNPFLPKADTIGINLFIRYPCVTGDCPYKRIGFTRPDVIWKPATPTSEFSMTFRPSPLPVGTYSLKAEAADASGNASGVEPYEITFVVSDQVGFLLRSVYPNPSYDQFNFRLLLNGPAIPDDFRMEVFSSSGQKIRSFGNEVLSLLHVGINDIAMSAVDATGNPLPAGIYHFRMTLVTGGIQFSKSGKLVVTR